MTATASKTSLKKWIRTASNFFTLILFHSICQKLASFSGVDTKDYGKACLYGGGGAQVGEVARLGEVTRLGGVTRPAI